MAQDFTQFYNHNPLLDINDEPAFLAFNITRNMITTLYIDCGVIFILFFIFSIVAAFYSNRMIRVFMIALEKPTRYWTLKLFLTCGLISKPVERTVLMFIKQQHGIDFGLDQYRRCLRKYEKIVAAMTPDQQRFHRGHLKRFRCQTDPLTRFDQERNEERRSKKLWKGIIGSSRVGGKKAKSLHKPETSLLLSDKT